MADPITSFPQAVRMIVDGESVDAATANRAPSANAKRTDYLLQLLKAIGAGEVLTLSGQPLAPGIAVGSPVYWDDDTARFEAAQAVVIDSTTSGQSAPKAFTVGLVMALTSPTEAQIGLYGRVGGISSALWAAVGVVDAGHYYLSPSSGRLTTENGVADLYVGQYLPGDQSFILRPDLPELGKHLHTLFRIAADPAVADKTDVNAPAPGGVHTITAPDSSARGWLPVASFDPATYSVPAGAVFGYNIAHTSEVDVNKLWPPQPLTSGVLEAGGLLLDTDLVVFNESGIWWMADGYGQAPWPVDYSTTGTADDMRLWFSRPVQSTVGGFVTAVQNHADSVLDLDILNGLGSPAAAGDLLLRVNKILNQAAADDNSAYAVKSITGGDYTGGAVTARVRAGAGVLVTGSHGTSDEGFHGTVTISSKLSADLYGSPASVALNNAREELVSDIPIVMLPSARNSAPIFRFDLSSVSINDATMHISAWLYSSTTGTTPGTITVAYRILPPSGGDFPPFSGSLTGLQGVNVVAGQYAAVDIGDIANVPTGSVVQLSVSRTGPTDGFSGDIGLIRVNYGLE